MFLFHLVFEALIRRPTSAAYLARRYRMFAVLVVNRVARWTCLLTNEISINDDANRNADRASLRLNSYRLSVHCAMCDGFRSLMYYSLIEV